MEEEKKTKIRNTTRTVLEFSGIGIQMLVTILLFNRLGVYLDERADAGTEHWTIGLTLGGVGVALYFMIKGLLKLLR